MSAAAAWEDISALSLAKYCHKLLGGPSQDGTKNKTSPCEDQSNEPTCKELIHQVDNNLSDEDKEQWLGEDVNDPGYQLLSEEEIVQKVK